MANAVYAGSFSMTVIVCKPTPKVFCKTNRSGQRPASLWRFVDRQQQCFCTYPLILCGRMRPFLNYENHPDSSTRGYRRAHCAYLKNSVTSAPFVVSNKCTDFSPHEVNYMLIGKPPDIPSSEITPRKEYLRYLSRRRFLKGATAAGAAALAPIPCPPCLGAKQRERRNQAANRL